MFQGLFSVSLRVLVSTDIKFSDLGVFGFSHKYIEHITPNRSRIILASLKTDYFEHVCTHVYVAQFSVVSLFFAVLDPDFVRTICSQGH